MRGPHTLTVEANGAAMKAARDWVGKIFESWGLDDYLGKLIVTELATNVVKHTDAEQMIVRVYVADAGPVVEVEDASPVLPVVLPLTEDSFSGRGLAMVEIFADALGWNATGDGGKCVWAVLPAVA
ncbi:ATP-binding protein [Actinomadura hibisca]|uniref:ATP-binding protein n=1 Tax=Actinomadura hibisca TaxID=68565 RepID=UPI00082C87EA|nr:ATP-binding protein [Actinomadura hibisca]